MWRTGKKTTGGPSFYFQGKLYFSQNLGPDMTRFTLLFAVTLLIGKTPLAQTKEQIDSIEAEFIKTLKNMARPSDSEIRAHQPPPRMPDTVHFAFVHAYKT